MESEQTVLITGASTGIGLAIARALCATPYRVILTAREASLPRFEAHASRAGYAGCASVRFPQAHLAAQLVPLAALSNAPQREHLGALRAAALRTAYRG